MLSARNATVVAILKVASKNRPWILFFSCSEKSAVLEKHTKKIYSAHFKVGVSHAWNVV